MKSIRKVIAGSMLASAGLLAAGLGVMTVGVAGAQTAIPPAAQPADNGGPGWGAHGHHGFGPEHAFQKLGLSPEQQQTIDGILSAARPQMHKLHEQMRANQTKLSSITPDDPNYGAVLAEVSQAQGTLHTQMLTERANTYAAMYAVLTPAQKSQLAALQAQWKAKWQAKSGKWGSAPPPASN